MTAATAITLTALDTEQPVALRGVRLTSRLAGLSQRTTLEHTFLNQEKRPIEARYTFPLPEGAAVCDFEVRSGERVLRAKVLESEEAIELYEEGQARGDGTYLLQEERPDVFTLLAGSLLPGQAVTLRVSYVSDLDLVDGVVRLSFPTTLAPRYVSAAGMDPTEAMIDGHVLNPPHALAVPYGLSMSVEVDLGCPLGPITSPSHTLTIRPDGPSRCRIELAEGQTEMNREIVLQIPLRQDQPGWVQVERGEEAEETFLAVSFLPELEAQEAPPEPGETVFLLDCSGSMAGASMEQARDALALCLRSLSEGDRFNICRFGSTFEFFRRRSQPYTQQTLEKALAWLSGVEADLGGTELYGPLRAALEAPLSAGGRQIILLTDGQVSNEPGLIDLARSRRGGQRIFTFGIGPACSQTLVHGLARATDGAAEFITYGERIEGKVLRTFSRLASPVVQEVKVDWGSAQVEQAAAELPPLFDGDRLVVRARVRGPLPAKVTLSCRSGAERYEWSLPLAEAREGEGRVLALLWARDTLREWERRIRETVHMAAGHLLSLSDEERRRGTELVEQRNRVVELSKRFGLLCKFTSLFAAEHRAVDGQADEQPAVRTIPVMLPAGWGGLVLPHAVPPVACASIAMPIAPVQNHVTDGDVAYLTRPSRLPRMQKLRAYRLSMPRPSRASSRGGGRPGKTSLLWHLLQLQQADGSFADEGAMGRLLKKRQESATACRTRAEALAAALLPAEAACERPVRRTLLALAILEICFADDRDQWQRAQRKAWRYLAKALGCSTEQIAERLRTATAELSPP